MNWNDSELYGVNRENVQPRESRYLRRNILLALYVPTKWNLLSHPAYTPQDIEVCTLTLSYPVKDMQVSTAPPCIHSWAEQLDI